MAETPLMQTVGAQPQKQPRSATIFTSRFNVGIWTNRNPLRSPLSAYYSEGWKLGSTDALLDGVNVEMSSRLTYCRRPGTLQWSSQVTDGTPVTFYSFKETVPAGTAPSAPPPILTVVGSTTRNYWFNGTTRTIISSSSFTNQSYFQGIGQTLYVGNGSAFVKWQDFGTGNPGNNNIPGRQFSVGPTPPFNYPVGTAAPTSAPTPVQSSGGSLTYTDSYGYVYAFKARTASDFYNTHSPPTGGAALGTPTGSASGLVSSASPPAVIANPATNIKITVSGLGSLDPQIDTIEVYRTDDGGSTYFLLTVLNAPQPVGGVAQPWSVIDNLPDTSLDILTVADQTGLNAPPNPAMINLTYHMGRMWGSVGNVVYCSAGPQINAPGLPDGNPNESWPQGNFFTFSAQVVKMIPVASGLLVFTTSRMEIIAGGTTGFTSFYSVPLVDGLGFLSYNALTSGGSVVYGMTSDRQVVTIDPANGVSEIGLPIGDVLSNINPAQAYLTFHVYGSRDKALYVGDGSTGWYRCNPNQAPDGAITGPVWSPKAVMLNGIGAIASVETSPGIHQLLIGSAAAGNSFITTRDSNYQTFTDAQQLNAGPPATYEAFFTMGAIILANPGQLAALNFLSTHCTAVGNRPTFSVLLDEIGGDFDVLVKRNSEPPRLAPSTTVYSDRYYFKQDSSSGGNPNPTYCLFMIVKVDYGTDTVQNELLSFSINGRILVEM